RGSTFGCRIGAGKTVGSSAHAAARARRLLLRAQFRQAPGWRSCRTMAAETGRTWSLIFIDGDHEGTAPLRDVKACATHAAGDAIILMHDLAAPAVAVAFNWLRAHGWNTMLYETMQIIGVAWRGKVKPIEHVPDPRIQA